MNSRPGRPRIAIAPLADVGPASPHQNILDRSRTLLGEFSALVEDIERQPAPSAPTDPDRVPLNERGALNVRDTAIYMGISVETVWGLKESGDLVPLDMPFRRTLFLRKDIDTFLQSRRSAAASNAA